MKIILPLTKPDNTVRHRPKNGRTSSILDTRSRKNRNFVSSDRFLLYLKNLWSTAVSELRGSRVNCPCHATFIKLIYWIGKVGSLTPLAQGSTYSSGCDLMMCLGKPKLCTKFEVASFSHCRNIKGAAPNFGELPYSRATPTFSSSVISWWAMANRSCMPNLKSLASSIAEI